MLADRIISGGLTLALAGLLAGSCLILASNAVQPAAISPGQAAGAWLVRHHLHSGLAGYWQASSITADTGDRAQVRPVREFQGRLTTTASESDASWYNPRLHNANFVILTRGGGCRNVCLSQHDLTAALGTPVRTYHFDKFVVLTWNKNILTDVRTLSWCGNVWPWATHTAPSPRPCPVQ